MPNTKNTNSGKATQTGSNSQVKHHQSSTLNHSAIHKPVPGKNGKGGKSK